MIVSLNPKPTMHEFSSLMQQTDLLLNYEASINPGYYRLVEGVCLKTMSKRLWMNAQKGQHSRTPLKKFPGKNFRTLSLQNITALR